MASGEAVCVFGVHWRSGFAGADRVRVHGSEVVVNHTERPW